MSAACDLLNGLDYTECAVSTLKCAHVPPFEIHISIFPISGSLMYKMRDVVSHSRTQLQ